MRRALVVGFSSLLFLEILCRGLLVLSEPAGRKALFGTTRLLHGYYPEILNMRKTSPKPPAIQILFLGGSVLSSYGFSDIERQLRDFISLEFSRPVTIHNLAVPAHSSRDSMLKYEMLKNQQFDLVLYYDSINDVRANNCPKEVFKTNYHHYSWYRDVDRIRLHQNGSFTVIPYVVGTLFSRIRTPVFIPAHEPRPEWMHYGNDLKTPPVFKQHLRKIAQLAAQKREPLLIATMDFYVPQNYDKELFHRKLLDYGKHTSPIELWGIPRNVIMGISAHNESLRHLVSEMGSDRVFLVDLEGTLPRKKRYFDDICHLTPAGSSEFVSRVGTMAVRILSIGKQYFLSSMTSR
jgi:hypothetical protein